jgi:DNA-binding FadR family transcriptional regulator
VLREAVRLLEHHSIATMRRGPGGGLFVTEPRLSTVSDTVALYLERRGMGVESLAELRTGVELAALDRVLDKVDDGVRGALDDALDAERSASDVDFVEVVGHDLHTALARLTRNPLLELLVLVLLRLTRRHIVNPTGARPRGVIDELTHAHSRIAEAVLAEDRELARHRMRRHLDAIQPYMA